MQILQQFEAMSWGLIPVCTKQCGYYKNKGIINIPLNDLKNTIKTLKACSKK